MAEPSPFFIGTGDEKGHITFEFPKAVTGYIARKFAGKMVEVEIRPYQDKRSDRQNRGFHAMITPWARSRGWEIEHLKQFLLSRVFGLSEFVDPETGEVIKVLAEPHTSALGVGQFSELIERTMELAAYDGCILEAPDEYRRRKQIEAKREARKAALEQKEQMA
jgi:hypothetical protein